MQTMQPMAYSAPVSCSSTEAKHQLGILVRYFSFFSPSPKRGWEKEKCRSIVKELIYRTISFNAPFGFIHLLKVSAKKTRKSIFLPYAQNSRMAKLRIDNHESHERTRTIIFSGFSG